MLRSRLSRTLAALAGLAVVSYLLVSLYLPSSRRLIFGVNRHDGSVRAVQGTITFLPPHEYYRLEFDKREGWAQRDGNVRITSRDGVPVTLNYRLRFGIAGTHIPDARRLVAEGWSAWMRARVAEAVSAVTNQLPIEELISPTSQFNTHRDPLRQTVTNHLAQSGLKVTAFEVARFDVDRDALLKAKRQELRREARSAPTRVAVFAIEGADWDLLSELGDDGRIPNIKAIVRGGASGSVQTIQPTIAPLLWTTVATGLPPDRHGVIDFFDHQRNAPVSAWTRRVPAVWDIAEAFGRDSEVVNWWTAWPSTSANAMVFDAPGGILENAVSPASAQAEAAKAEIPLSTVGYDQVRRFLNISPAEYDQSVRAGGPSDPVNIFRGVLAKTWSDHRVALTYYAAHKPTLMMLDYDGTDAVNHLFAPYHPPQRSDIPDQQYRKYWPAVSNYYSEVDRLIGEWMNVLPADTTIILVSAHGYRWGKNRPTTQPNGGAALSDHRNPGIFAMYGQHIVPSRAAHPISLYDLAPTLLALLGLPPSSEMPGKPVVWAFKDVPLITSVRVVSYGEFVGSRPVGPGASLDAKAYTQQLQAIGHLNDPSRNLAPVLEEDQQDATAKPLPPDQWGRYAYYNNLGVTLRGQGKFKESIEAFQQAIELNPARPTPYLNLAMTLCDKQQYTAADDAFQQAVAHGLPGADRWFVDFAALYRERDMPSRAIALLYKGKQMFPQSYLVAANLGSALVAATRYTEGVPELERALGLQPASTEVLNNLGMCYAKKEDLARALDYWNRSLAIDPRQPKIRDAVNAAETRL